jgi:hypothetical protein
VAAKASAQEVSAADRQAAAEAYDNGTRRYLQRDYAGAANWFETANRMAPSSLALSNAVRAHQQAGGAEHLARAATLALRLQSQYPSDAQAQRLAQRTLQQAAGSALRVTVNCNSCEIEADGAVQQGNEFFVTPGTHRIVGHWSAHRTRESNVEGSAGQTQTVTIEEPPMPVDTAQNAQNGATDSSASGGGTTSSSTQAVSAPARGGVSPFFFVGGLVVTAALGGVAIWSWIDATRQGNDLITYAMTNHTRNPMLEQSVASAETRTLALDIATGAVGAVSLGLLIATLVTRPSARTERHVSVSASPGINGYTGLTVSGAF